MRTIGRGAMCMVVLGVLLGVAACSRDDSGTNSGGGQQSGPTTGGTAATTASGGGVKALVDIVDCENDGGSGTASGTVRNQGTEAAAFKLEVGFTDVDNGKRITSGKTTTKVVEPGKEVEWSLEVDGLGDADVECSTVAVETTSGT